MRSHRDPIANTKQRLLDLKWATEEDLKVLYGSSIGERYRHSYSHIARVSLLCVFPLGVTRLEKVKIEREKGLKYSWKRGNEELDAGETEEAVSEPEAQKQKPKYHAEVFRVAGAWRTLCPPLAARREAY